MSKFIIESSERSEKHHPKITKWTVKLLEEYQTADRETQKKEEMQKTQAVEQEIERHK